MTRSPALTVLTSGPTLSTVPANSAAGENGSGGLVWYLLAMINVSKKFKAAALTRTTASPAAGTGSGISAIVRSSGVPWRVQSRAFMTILWMNCTHAGEVLARRWGPPDGGRAQCVHGGGLPPSHCRLSPVMG